MIYTFLADGFEEIEALTPCDALRRAGIEVMTVGIGKKQITGSHGICVTADITDTQLKQTENLDGILLPGGMPGTVNLAASETVGVYLDRCRDQGKLIAAICAAPSVLGQRGLLIGKRAVCYPGFEDKLTGAVIGEDSVVTDGNIITAKGAGVAWEFAFAVIAYLSDKEKADQIAESIQCRR